MREKIKFTINCEMESRWVNTFISMLKFMETLGEIGSSRNVSLYSDGDGDFRPKFTLIGVDHEEVPPSSGIDGNHNYDAG